MSRYTSKEGTMLDTLPLAHLRQLLRKSYVRMILSVFCNNNSFSVQLPSI